MLTPIKQETLTSVGHELNCSPDAFGSLKDSSDIIHQLNALRQRMQDDGYLYLSGFLNAETIWQARQELCDRLSAEGCLVSGTPSIEAIAKPDLNMHFRPDLVHSSPTLQTVLYSGNTIKFFQQFLGGKVRHFDYTWLRAVAPGLGTYPHCDMVYMGRGTSNLFTSWVPLGNVPLEMGGP